MAKLTYKDQMSWDENGGPQAISLPEGVYTKIQLDFTYTVTDAGISAGENIRGLLRRLHLGDSEVNLLPVETDELGEICDMFSPGPSAATYSDPTPTTAVEQRASFTLAPPLPFQLIGAKGGKAELRIEMQRAIAEWAGATALTCLCTVTAWMADEGDEQDVGIRVQRVDSASRTKHTGLHIQPTNLLGYLLIAGSGGVVDEVRIGSKYQEDDENALAAAYDRHKEQAETASPTHYYEMLGLAGIIEFEDDKVDVFIDMTSAATATLFTMGAGA